MPEDKAFLEVQAEMSKLQALYADDRTQTTFNLLILGEMGTGKTHLLKTCRRPIHVDSFDPGGTKHLIEGIREGWIIVDSRYEHEDPMKPTSFNLWLSEMNRRQNMGYFRHVGTYALDSMTLWAESIMNETLRRAGIAGQMPRYNHDYQPTKNTIKNLISMLLSLECDIIVTGHLRPDKDEASGTMRMRLVTIGDLDAKLPALFDEVWIMNVKDASKGPDYSILTSPRGLYRDVRTRMGSGKFDQFEKPDVSYLLAKAGHATSKGGETS
jgi:hypothetical protein